MVDKTRTPKRNFYAEVPIVAYTVTRPLSVIVEASPDTVSPVEVNAIPTVNAKVVAASGLRIKDVNDPGIPYLNIALTFLCRLGYLFSFTPRSILGGWCIDQSSSPFRGCFIIPG